MKRYPNKQKTELERDRTAVLIFLTVSFLIGAVLGCVLEHRFSADSYIEQFLTQLEQGDAAYDIPLWRILFPVLGWPIGTLILGALPMAGLSIPVLFLFRSGTLAYNIAAMSGGWAAMGYAGLIYGAAGLLTIPVLFILGTESLLRKAQLSSVRSLLTKSAVCAPILVLAIGFEQNVPNILKYILSLR